MIKAIKKKIKRVYLAITKNINIDKYSDLNAGVKCNYNKKSRKIIIRDSKCNFTSVNEGCVITEARCYGNIHLGKFVTITGPGTVIKSLKEEIVIGSYSSIGQNVCIVDFNHLHNRISSSFFHYLLFNESFLKDIVTKGPVIIEEDVWIGSNSVILPGVTLGRGSIIGAGSIVTKSVPRYSIVYGNPASVKSMRFKDSSIKKIEELKWWNWTLDEIEEKRNMFSELYL
jgi:virginiamycin A acetyltransferase